nr:MAG: hypothetical protein [Bacteriophage sp.]
MNDKYTMKNAERLKQAEKWLEWRSVFLCLDCMQMICDAVFFMLSILHG